jgi:hypothetical protein
MFLNFQLIVEKEFIMQYLRQRFIQSYGKNWFSAY